MPGEPVSLGEPTTETGPSLTPEEREEMAAAENYRGYYWMYSILVYYTPSSAS